jgi:hypothetical protein
MLVEDEADSKLLNKDYDAPATHNDPHSRSRSRSHSGDMYRKTSRADSKASNASSLAHAINDFAVPEFDQTNKVTKGNGNSFQQSLLGAEVNNDMDDDPPMEKSFNKYDINEIPWKAMFTHPASIALFVSNWSFGWIGFMLLSEMPSYLVDCLGYDLEESGLLSIAPYAANFASVVLFAQLFDYLQVASVMQ